MDILVKLLELDALGPTFSRTSPSTYLYSNFQPIFNASFFFFNFFRIAYKPSLTELSMSDF